MRKLIVAGNWKMNTNLEEGIKLAEEVEKASGIQNVELIIAPPFTHLTEVKKVLNNVNLSAQNCASEENGAYTGEVSVDMIKSTGASHVIIGHSERRTYYKEDNETLKKKVLLTIKANLTPIFCCGELLEEREAGKLFEVIKTQIEEAVFNLNEEDFRKIIIAYEPVWAIGTGKVATPDQAQEMHKFIRDLVVEKYGEKVADDLTILYGGSCKPSNAKEIFANPDVDGGLIGGAALKAEDFIAIAKSF